MGIPICGYAGLLKNTYKSVLFKLDGCPNFASRFENTVAEAGCSVLGPNGSGVRKMPMRVI